MTKQIWTRREGESSIAYEAFKAYLHLGKDRSLQAAADDQGKSQSMMARWSHTHRWVERSRAYDSYVLAADTDGMIHMIAEARDKNLALMEKLRGLLDMRLDDFIARRDDPTIRWTQACVAMTKIEANSLIMGKESKQDESVERIESLIEKALELQNRVPEGS